MSVCMGDNTGLERGAPPSWIGPANWESVVDDDALFACAKRTDRAAARPALKSNEPARPARRRCGGGAGVRAADTAKKIPKKKKEKAPLCASFCRRRRRKCRKKT